MSALDAQLPLGARLPWDEIDTVLLDMDGTLLDLGFDNFFWLELVPDRYAELHDIPAEEARRDIARRYERVLGRLEWYCLDHWSVELGLDIARLKREHRHRIGYLPGATSFLAALREAGKPVDVVTNAHPETISIKAAQTGLDARVDAFVCSHDLEAPKESLAFWEALVRRRPFDRERTLLVEDSLPVLAAATDFGVRHTVAIRQPDTGRPPREIVGFRSVDRIADLL